MYIIYKTTCLINGKVYIGQHQVQNLQTFDPQYLGSGTVLGKAIKKYGKENFDRKIICKISSDDISKVNKLEEYFIKKFNCLEIGYNLIGGSPFEHNPMKNPIVAAKVSYKLRNGCHHNVSGSNNPNYGNGSKISGDKNPMKNPEIAKINSGLRRGKIRSVEQRLNISNSKKNKCLGKDNPNFGNFWSEEKKQALSKKLKNKNKLKIVQNENIVC